MSGFLGVLLAYPRFVLDFFLLRAFTDFENRGVLSATLIFFFFVGLGLALLVSVVHPPQDDVTGAPDPRVPDIPARHLARRMSEDIVRLTIVIIGGAIILHGLMAVYADVVSPVAMGGTLDTVNAAFGYAAVYLPLHATLARIHRRIVRINRRHQTGSTKAVKVVLGLFQLLFPVFFLVALGQVYGTPVRELVRPAIVSAIGTVVAVTGVVAIVLLLLRGNPPVKG